jgi:Tol biopolymer transport system component
VRSANAEGRWLTQGNASDRQPCYSPDDEWVVFSSNRSGNLDLWEVSRKTGAVRRLTDDPADDWDPGFTPDGKLIWSSNRSGAFEIWTARRDATSPRQVSRDSVDAENPSVSPDQKWLIYSSAHPRKFGLWRIPVAGGEGEHLMNTATLIPELSPDGRYISVISEVGTPESRLSVYDLEERRALPAGVPLQVVSGTVQVGRARFTADGRAVAFVHARPDGQGVLVRRPVSAWRDGSGRTDTLFAASTETVESFGFSPDAQRVVVSLVDWLSSLTITDRVAGIVPPRQAGK